MTDQEKLLKKLEAAILEAFPEASPRDAMIMSGFVAIYCTALPDVKEFFTIVIRETLADAKQLNRSAMEAIEAKIEELRASKDKKILN